MAEKQQTVLGAVGGRGRRACDVIGANGHHNWIMIVGKFYVKRGLCASAGLTPDINSRGWSTERYCCGQVRMQLVLYTLVMV